MIWAIPLAPTGDVIKSPSSSLCLQLLSAWISLLNTSSNLRDPSCIIGEKPSTFMLGFLPHSFSQGGIGGSSYSISPLPQDFSHGGKLFSINRLPTTTAVSRPTNVPIHLSIIFLIWDFCIRVFKNIRHQYVFVFFPELPIICCAF